MKNLNVLTLVLIALLTFSFTAYSQEKAAHLLNNTSFQKEIEKTEVQLVDVRTPKEYAEGTIEYAKNIDFLNENFLEQTKTLSKDKPVYIFCKSGKRSEKARNTLLENGFKQVYELDGGYTKWVEVKK
ncbi:rhodanese-like domain-containing protein [Myroides marinus]|uniref:Rhodanese-related sulfurtransferase n=1 Tax=Myroides marinus TaxID=703342 RepID=A0A1H6UJM0_9FLAO|nr:rhodanese-like domain-containing protein [Myroides marinus]MDM1503375.1 rhodanese-like domain-containing protein [Myroides marinus]SEI88365.1 Rhodanese-related sulfurtransferase [Myroides marinus]